MTGASKYEVASAHHPHESKSPLHITPVMQKASTRDILNDATSSENQSAAILHIADMMHGDFNRSTWTRRCVCVPRRLMLKLVLGSHLGPVGFQTTLLLHVAFVARESQPIYGEDICVACAKGSILPPRLPIRARDLFQYLHPCTSWNATTVNAVHTDCLNCRSFRVPNARVPGRGGWLAVNSARGPGAHAS